jgi:hypothetical protein
MMMKKTDNYLELTAITGVQAVQTLVSHCGGPG